MQEYHAIKFREIPEGLDEGEKIRKLKSSFYVKIQTRSSWDR